MRSSRRSPTVKGRPSRPVSSDPPRTTTNSLVFYIRPCRAPSFTPRPNAGRFPPNNSRSSSFRRSSVEREFSSRNRVTLGSPSPEHPNSRRGVRRRVGISLAPGAEERPRVSLAAAAVQARRGPARPEGAVEISRTWETASGFLNCVPGVRPAHRRQYESHYREGSAPSGRSLHDTSSSKRSARDERVDRPRAGAVDDQGDRRAKREEVVLHALALLCTEPVHKEAVLLVNQDRHEHDDRDAERRDSRE